LVQFAENPFRLLGKGELLTAGKIRTAMKFKAKVIHRKQGKDTCKYLDRHIRTDPSPGPAGFGTHARHLRY
jgi:hypothetical protein